MSGNPNPYISRYRHLTALPQADVARNTLIKVATVVKPIMENWRFRVGTLEEFYPDESNLLGAL